MYPMDTSLDGDPVGIPLTCHQDNVSFRYMQETARTRFLILGLLAEGPCSGYDIRRITLARFGFFWSESFGQIYPCLMRMEAEGLVEGKGGALRGRVLWAITASGRQAACGIHHAITLPRLQNVNRCLSAMREVVRGRRHAARQGASHVSNLVPRPSRRR